MIVKHFFDLFSLRRKEGKNATFIKSFVGRGASARQTEKRGGPQPYDSFLDFWIDFLYDEKQKRVFSDPIERSTKAKMEKLRSLFSGRWGKLEKEPWKARLYTPTVIEKYRDDYFIVDCWHHRVLYHNDLTAPVKRWHTLVDSVGTPHSIASDGELFLTEDSVRSKILVFAHRHRTGGGIPSYKSLTTSASVHTGSSMIP